jgi:hypothetical protein
MQKPTRPIRRGGSRLAAIVGLAATALAATPALAPAQLTMPAPSTSPLHKIYISDTLNCQVRRKGWPGFAFGGGTFTGSCGTFLSVGGTTYGPAVAGYTPVPYTTGKQGKMGSLYAQCIQTDVDVTGTSFKIIETDCYRVGDVFYTTAIRVTNSGPAQAVTLYHAADCRVDGNTLGRGRHPVGTERIFCTRGNSLASPVGAAIGFIPTDMWGTPLAGAPPGVSHIEGTPAAVAAGASGGAAFVPTCCAPLHDNAMGLSVIRSVPAGGSFTVYGRTRF